MNTVSQSQPILPSNGQPSAETSAAALPSVVLDRVAALIEPEGAWTQGYYARDASGVSVEPDAAAAVCWCAVGVLIRVGALNLMPDNASAEPFLIRAIGAPGVVRWNDAPERTQAEVVTALRKAAELARSEGQ